MKFIAKSIMDWKNHETMTMMILLMISRAESNLQDSYKSSRSWNIFSSSFFRIEILACVS